ncbi:hypothetical protein ACT7DF_33220 [Bacillus cereus]
MKAKLEEVGAAVEVK